MKGQFLLNTVAFSSATLVSRILGYLRDATVAYVFGANPLTDAFFVAWRLPNTLRQLIGEGSFNAAFIPVYTEEEKNSKESAQKYASSLFTYYTLLLSLLTFFVVIFADIFVKVIAPGFVQKGNFEETVSLVRVVFPYLVLIGWVSFFMALLNTRDRFFIPALTPALLNLSFIIFALLFSSKYGIYALAYGALFGGFLQVIIQLPLLKKENLLLKPSLNIHPQIIKTVKRLLPAFASFGVSQFAFVIDTVIASFLVGGAISYLYYGNRIFLLPMGLFAIGLGNALLVSLSKHFSSKDIQSFNHDVNMGIKLSFFISVPAMVGMLVLGKEIIDVLLLRGAFTEKDAILTYYALAGYSIGLTGYALTRPFKSAFFATGDTKIPLYSTMFGLIIGIIFAIILGFILRWGVFGLALASSIGGWANAFYLYFVYPFDLDKRSILFSFLKVFFSSFVMALFIFVLKISIQSELL
ncbi:MAG: murein biosynthesis integral membrane protein MurJ, partial [Aquificota bacterium]